MIFFSVIKSGALFNINFYIGKYISKLSHPILYLVPLASAVRQSVEGYSLRPELVQEEEADTDEGCEEDSPEVWKVGAA